MLTAMKMKEIWLFGALQMSSTWLTMSIPKWLVMTFSYLVVYLTQKLSRLGRQKWSRDSPLRHNYTTKKWNQKESYTCLRWVWLGTKKVMKLTGLPSRLEQLSREPEESLATMGLPWFFIVARQKRWYASRWSRTGRRGRSQEVQTFPESLMYRTGGSKMRSICQWSKREAERGRKFRSTGSRLHRSII